MNLRTATHRIRDAMLFPISKREFRPAEPVQPRIAIVRPDHIGDLLMLTPALKVLESIATHHETVLVVGPWNLEVAEHLAPNSRVETINFPGFRREVGHTRLIDPYRQLFEAASRLRDLSPQAVALMRDDHWWGAWMAREAGPPIRLGYENRLASRFLTHQCRLPRTHYVAQNVELIRRLLALLGYTVEHPAIDPVSMPLEWPVHEDSVRQLDELIGKRIIASPFVVLHPGSGAAVKLWSGRRWASVADRIARQTGHSIVLTGSGAERELCDEISHHASVSTTNLAGQTSLFLLGELLRRASLVLGVDSGPLHLSVAAGTPSIHLFGPSDHIRYGPWGPSDRHRVIRSGMSCPDCGNLAESRPAGCGCMMAITVDTVADAALGMLHDEQSADHRN
jgi:heptosyltransferase III